VREAAAHLVRCLGMAPVPVGDLGTDGADRDPLATQVRVRHPFPSERLDKRLVKTLSGGQRRRLERRAFARPPATAVATALTCSGPSRGSTLATSSTISPIGSQTARSGRPGAVTAFHTLAAAFLLDDNLGAAGGWALLAGGRTSAGDCATAESSAGDCATAESSAGDSATAGSNDICVNDRTHATFHRMSNISASAVCRSDKAHNSLSTSTLPTRSAGSDGRPVPDGNRSAMNSSPNTAHRCSARNANTLPAGLSVTG
jgi:hypothetical protein